MNKEMICKNCKYHYIEEISFDYPQSCCSKRMATTEEWCKCNDFEYGNRYIELLQQENKILKENAENNGKVVDKVNWENQLLKKENEQLQKELEEYKNPIRYFKYANKNVVDENKQLREVIDKANKKLNNFIDCCKAEKLESGSDYIHHQYWDMFERFNKKIKDILKEVK